MSETKKTSTKGRSILAVLAVLFLLTAAFFAWQYFSNKTKMEEMILEKEETAFLLQQELDSLLFEHDSVKVQFDELAVQLQGKDSIIQENAKEIKSLLNTKWQYNKVRKKLDKLREISQGYLKQIDELYVKNAELQDENVKIKRQYNLVKLEKEKLVSYKEETDEIISKAAAFKAYGIDVETVHKKKSNGKEIPTNKARRTDRIKICCTIAENILLGTGLKDIYFRISRPDNLILTPSTTDDYAFDFQGNTLQYSMKETINYDGGSKRICKYWNHIDKDPMMKGQYILSIFTNEKKIGETGFELK